jgi:hypothetical protein
MDDRDDGRNPEPSRSTDESEFCIGSPTLDSTAVADCSFEDGSVEFVPSRSQFVGGGGDLQFAAAIFDPFVGIDHGVRVRDGIVFDTCCHYGDNGLRLHMDLCRIGIAIMHGIMSH